jgi:hemoglobin/transferrin/lactoferrin receptor protein
MHHPHRPLLTPLATAALCALSGPSPAQEAPTLPSISVTAKGYAARDAETPAAQLLLTREDLWRRQAQNLGEALRGQPGLSVASDGAQGQNPVIRGLKKESIVLLVDGVRLNSAQPQGAIASFMTLGLAESVEVVKGPASVLYGSGALGGAIQLRLPQARFAPGWSLRATAGLDSASEGARGSALLNASTGDHALMLGASVARPDDYRAPAGTVALTGYDSDAAITQYRLRLDATQQLRASAQLQQDRDVWYPGSKKPHPNAAVVGHTLVHSPRQERRLVEAGYERRGTGEQPLNVDLRLYRQDVDRTIWSYSDRLARDIGQTRVRFSTDGLDARAEWVPTLAHLLSFGLNAWRTLPGQPHADLAAGAQRPLRRRRAALGGRLPAGRHPPGRAAAAGGPAARPRAGRCRVDEQRRRHHRPAAARRGHQRQPRSDPRRLAAAAALCQPLARLPRRRDARALRILAAR